MNSPEQTRILVVEDSGLMRSIFLKLLTKASYGDVVAVATIHEAMLELGLDTAQPESAGVGGQGFHLVLMDKELPDGDGIDAIQKIRADQRTHDVPVIMVTSNNDQETLQAALDAGATDFLTKNFSEIELLARVRSALRLDSALRSLKVRQQELLELAEKLERLTLTDGLTQIANRRHFDIALDITWRAAKREAECVSIVVMDVDFFKRYNDSLGHQAGDECLQVIAKTLQATLRRPRDLMARYGGEEFAAILVNTDATGAAFVAERLRLAIQNLQRPHPNSSVGTDVTISLGVASKTPEDTIESFEALFQLADQALYLAKSQGRNRVYSQV